MKDGKKEQKKGCSWVFCKEYTNRWGQLMVAANYGYQFWRFPIKSKRRG